MHYGHFESFGTFIVVPIVVRFDVKQDGKSVVLARLGTFRHGTEPKGPIGVRTWKYKIIDTTRR